MKIAFRVLPLLLITAICTTSGALSLGLLAAVVGAVAPDGLAAEEAGSDGFALGVLAAAVVLGGLAAAAGDEVAGAAGDEVAVGG